MIILKKKRMKNTSFEIHHDILKYTEQYTCSPKSEITRIVLLSVLQRRFICVSIRER